VRRAALVGLAIAGLAGCGPHSSSTGAVSVTRTRDFAGHRDGPVRHTSARGGDTLEGLTARVWPLGPARGRDRWFGFVNGVQQDRGAGLHPGDQVLWDRHDARAAARIPAVVAQFPEPFLHGSGGRRPPLRLECAGDAGAACDLAASRLTAAGVSVNRAVLGAPAGKDTARVLVGPWTSLRGDAAAAQLARGPRTSGIYARPADGGAALDVLDVDGAVATRLTAGTGLVAATRFAGQEPTWIVLGTDDVGLRAAAGALSSTDLADRFAAVVRGGRVSSVPEAGR
jgi:hypothetical protein